MAGALPLPADAGGGRYTFYGGYKKRVTPEIKWLGIGGAAAMAFTDFFYVFSGELREVYLLEGIAELILIGLWFWAANRGVAQFAIPKNR